MEGERGGGGEYEGECLFDNDHDEDEYDDNNKYNNKEDGNGSRGGADDGGKSNYDGHDVIRGPSFGSMGQRTLINGPYATATFIDDDDFDNDRRRSGGASCPPPLVCPVLPDAACLCRCRRPWSMAAAQGRSVRGRMRGGGGSSALLYSFIRF
jgi:hypothetical protein